MDNVDEKFTGQIRDTETLNDFFNARYYTAPLMRFLSSDPGNAGADPTDPQTWNAYAYVRNNPLILIDPTGMDICSDGSWADACVTASNPPWWYFMNGLGSWYMTWLYSGNSNSSSSGTGGGGQTSTPPQKPQQSPPNNGNNTCASTTWVPHGIGISYGANADIGVGLAGATATGSAGIGLFQNSNQGMSAGAFATGGASAYALNHVAGAPRQMKQPLSFLAYAGAGLGLVVTNARSVQQLGGPFNTATINVGLGPVTGAVQVSWAGGIWEVSITPPIPYVNPGIGVSGSLVTTNTVTTASGCH